MAGLEGIDATSMDIIDALGARRFAYDEEDHVAKPILVPTSFVPVAVNRPAGQEGHGRRETGGDGNGGDRDDRNDSGDAGGRHEGRGEDGAEGPTERVVDRARFGLPGFQGRIVTNARDDKLRTAATWKTLLGKPGHHGLAAVSYVVERDRASGTTYRVQRRDAKPLVIASLCAVRHYRFTSTGNEYDDLGHVQVTTAANRFVATIHDRFVCELADRADQDAWMAPQDHDSDDLVALLRPAPDDRYEFVPISGDIWKRGEKPADIAAPAGRPVRWEDVGKQTGLAEFG